MVVVGPYTPPKATLTIDRKLPWSSTMVRKIHGNKKVIDSQALARDRSTTLFSTCFLHRALKALHSIPASSGSLVTSFLPCWHPKAGYSSHTLFLGEGTKQWPTLRVPLLCLACGTHTTPPASLQLHPITPTHTTQIAINPALHLLLCVLIMWLCWSPQYAKEGVTFVRL